MATPSARRSRPGAAQAGVSMVMPSVRPEGGVASGRRRLRPRRRARSRQGARRLGSLSSPPWPSGRPELIWRWALLAVAFTTVMETGYVKVWTSGACEGRRDGVISTTSRTAWRRMQAGSRERADSRKMARLERERVSGWRRSIQQLLPSRCSSTSARPAQGCHGVRARHGDQACRYRHGRVCTMA